MGLIEQNTITFSVERLTTVGNKQNYIEISTGNGGFFQPVSAKEGAALSGDYSKMVSIYFDRSINIKIGDRIIVDSSDTWDEFQNLIWDEIETSWNKTKDLYCYVNGLQDFNYGSLNHKKALLEIKNV